MQGNTPTSLQFHPEMMISPEGNNHLWTPPLSTQHCCTPVRQATDGEPSVVLYYGYEPTHFWNQVSFFGEQTHKFYNAKTAIDQDFL